MKKTFSLYLLCCAFVAQIGCIEQEKQLFLNPDGSGKMVYKLKRDRVFPSPTRMHQGIFPSATPQKIKEDARTRRDLAKKLAKGIIQNVGKSVEVWSGVSYRMDADGIFYFEGTAYFPDIVAFQKAFVDQDYGKKQPPNPVLDMLVFHYQKKDKNKEAISLHKLGWEEANEPETLNLTEEEVNTEILIGRKMFEHMDPLMGVVTKDMKLSFTIEFAGEILAAHNLLREGPNKVRFVLEGEKLYKVMKEIYQDDALARMLVKENGRLNLHAPLSEESQRKVNALFFDEEGPIEVIIQPGEKPLFDYQAEVKRAKQSFSSTKKDLFE